MGPHEELMRQQGIYYRMVLAQEAGILQEKVKQIHSAFLVVALERSFSSDIVADSFIFTENRRAERKFS